MKELDRSALQAFDSKNHILLKVVGEGADKHLEAKQKGFWGRLWIEIKLQLGITSPYALEKVAAYVQLNAQDLIKGKHLFGPQGNLLRADQVGDIELLKKLDVRLVSFQKSYSKKPHSNYDRRPLLVFLNLTDAHIKLELIISDFEKESLAGLQAELTKHKKDSNYWEFFQLPPNASMEALEARKNDYLKQLDPLKFDGRQRAQAKRLAEEVEAMYRHILELEKLR